MITKYKINRWASEGLISRVEIEKETAEFVMLPANSRGGYSRPAHRERKDGNYFDTFEDARAELVRRCEVAVQRADDARSRAIQLLKNAREFVL